MATSLFCILKLLKQIIISCIVYGRCCGPGKDEVFKDEDSAAIATLQSALKSQCPDQTVRHMLHLLWLDFIELFIH
jgi:hypothetical protein